MKEKLEKINMSDHAKGKFLWHIQWQTAIAFLAKYKKLAMVSNVKKPNSEGCNFVLAILCEKKSRHFIF